MPAMDVMLVVIVMVVVLVLAILYAMQIKSSGEEQTFNLGGKMDIYGPGSTDRSGDIITANDIRFELNSEKDQNFDMVAIADYADSGGKRQMIYAGYDTSITYGPIIPISSSDLTTPCSSNYVYKLHDCAGGHHPALDLYAPCGTPIRATCGGYLTKEHRSSFCSEHGDYEYVKIVNDGNCKDSDGSNNYIYYSTYYAGITIRDDISEEVDKNGHATVSQGEIIGYVDTDTPNYEPGCHLHFIITNDANFLDSRTDPAFVCSRDQYSNGPTNINYPKDNPVDLVFDLYDNSIPEKPFLHITFWACVKDKDGNCACIDDYMSKNDKKLNELIDGCPSFYIGSVDAVPLVTTTTTTTLPPTCQNVACIGAACPAPCSGCVDCVCRASVPKACTGNDPGIGESICYPGDCTPPSSNIINKNYCSWNIHDGVLVKSGIVEVGPSGNVGDFWEEESCGVQQAPGGGTPMNCESPFSTSDLYGEKVINIYPSMDEIGVIEGVIWDVDDEAWVSINNNDVAGLHDTKAGGVKRVDITSYFHQGNNTVSFKASDICDGRSITLDINVDQCQYPHIPPKDTFTVGGNAIDIYSGAVDCMININHYCTTWVGSGMPNNNIKRAGTYSFQYRTDSSGNGFRQIGLDDRKFMNGDIELPLIDSGDCDMNDIVYRNSWSVVGNNRFIVTTDIISEDSGIVLAAGFSIDIPQSFSVCDSNWNCGVCQPANSYFERYVYEDYKDPHSIYFELC